MSNLEQSIVEWRKQMLAAGIEPSALSELESHLREEIEKQTKSGLSPGIAFETAVKAIGRGVELKKEFKKAGEPLTARLVKLISIGCGAISFMLSLWFLLFIFKTGPAAFVLGLIAVATSVLCWRYSYKFLPVIHHEPVRAIAGLVCCVGSVVWIQLFFRDVAPVLMEHPPGMDMAVSRLLATVLWASTVMAILSSIGYGLEKAARKRETANS
jgi:hypothetical protein